MNRWHFAFTFDPSGGLARQPGTWFNDPNLHIECENLHPMPRRFAIGRRHVFLFGNPIAGGRRDDDAVLAALGDGGDPAAGARDIGGSFLILVYDPERATLCVLSDRFAALALYYCVEGGVWRAASSLKLLRDRGHDAGLDETAAAEFLFLRRLLGEKTLAANIRYLPSATLLQVSAGGTRETCYWSPDYSKAPVPDRELPERIASVLRSCVSSHLSDGRKTAILLSGGLDSRALLAAAPRQLVCFTTCRRENNESAVAREVAQAAGAPFHFVPRPAGLLDGALDDAAFLTGGQQTYVEAQFLGYARMWPEEVESFFIGLGPDILFGGLYLPKESPAYFGRQALHYRLRPLESDLASMYLSGVSYRLKQSDPFLVVRKEYRQDIRERLLAAIGTIMDRGRGLGASGYGLWEHMHTHNLSRHYSFPMIMSVRSYADCRAPALDNDVFDLSLRMTAAQKVNGTAYQAAISRLAPSLMRIRNANTNLAAGMPLPRQTLTKTLRYVGNRLFGTGYPVAPGAAERSWPAARESLLASPSILARARELPRSAALASIPFIAMDGVRTAVDDCLEGRRDHTVLLNVLLTLDAYLRPPA